MVLIKKNVKKIKGRWKMIIVNTRDFDSFRGPQPLKI